MAQPACVFGYGSLMEKASRTRTNPKAIEARPARVSGYQRGWFHQFSNNVGFTCTYLGAFANAAATFNGVVYEVEDFEKTKQRETGYTPAKVKVEMLDGHPWDPSKDVYIFVSDPSDISKTKEPTATLPMVESYVDICVTGCMEIEAQYPKAHGFLQEFFKSTTGWNKHWVNDRLYPRRPFIYQPNASDIDAALQKANLLQYVQLPNGE